MNQLSWLIYLAEVSDKVGGVAIAVIIFSCIASIAALIWFSTCLDSSTYSFEDREVVLAARASGRKSAIKIFLTAATVAGVAALLSIAAPSKDTVYAIAASEMGEKALQTETASKAFKALNAWLDRQITPAPEAK